MNPLGIKLEIISRFMSKNFRSLHIQGSPGIGKTEIVAQVAKELGIGFKVIHAPLMQPEDYGFPVVSPDKSSVSFIVSKDKFPVEGSNCPETGILLIDELSQCDHSSQKVLANLIQAREIHGQKLKNGWLVVSTGNRTIDRAGAVSMLAHLNDRHTKVTLEPSQDDWIQWALNNGVKIEVIAWARFRWEAFTDFNPQHEKNATPRGWVQGVSASLGITAPEREFEVFKGDVGEGRAAEFLGFLKMYRKLPSIDAILLDPVNTPVPDVDKDSDAGSVLYALAGAIAHRSTVDNFGRLTQYASRMPGEFTVLYVRDAIRCRSPQMAKNCACEGCKIKTSKDFIKWASGDGAKILT